MVTLPSKNVKKKIDQIDKEQHICSDDGRRGVKRLAKSIKEPLRSETQETDSAAVSYS